MSDVRYYDLPHGVTTIDTDFMRPGLVASHLLVEGEQAAFIDVGVGHAVAVLLNTLTRKGIAPNQVRYVMVTHVHLDHAAASGALLRHLPEARLVVHPRGARHMIDPSKLMAGAGQVYGAQELSERFGEMVPVSEERVIEAADGFTLEMGRRTLLFVDTPGHARHHYCVVDEASRGVFTGDTFGLSYREFDTARGPFVFPTTTPVQFDPTTLHASIDRLLAFHPERMYLTHFGCVGDVTRLGADLHRMVDRLVGLAQQVADDGAQRHRRLLEGMADILLEALARHGCSLSRERVLALMAMDLELNAQGLGVWLDRSNVSEA